jgi:cytoskeletal protein CcmA (bactofilin family)
MRSPLALLTILLFCSAAHGKQQTAMDWALKQIRSGQIADFNVRCGRKLDPRKDDGWNDSCRRIPAQFLQDLLTNPKRQAEVARLHRVRFRGVRIDGEVDLSDADIDDDVWIDGSRIEGGLNLDDSHWSRYLSLDGSKVSGMLRAERMRCGALYWRRAVFGRVDLADAKVGGQLVMSGSSFDGTVDADSLSVGGDLLMREDTKFKDVSLRGAKVSGQLDMSGSSFDGTLDADSLSVGGDLLMREHAKFKDLVLRDANVGGQLDMSESWFDGTLYADGLSVGDDAFMRDRAKFKYVVLFGAKVTGHLDMTDSSFGGTLNAESLSVSGDLFMSGRAKFKDVSLLDAKVGGQLRMDRSSFDGLLVASGLSVGNALFMRNAKFRTVDIIAAKISGALEMTGSSFDGTLNAHDLSVDGYVLMNGPANFRDVIMQGTKVSGTLNMSDSFFDGTLDARGLSVSNGIVMRKAKFGDVNMIATKVGGPLEMTYSSFDGMLLAENLNVGGYLSLIGATAWRVDLADADITQDLNIADLEWRCSANDWSAAPIRWPLRDNSAPNPVQCQFAGPTMVLHNVHVGNLQDSDNAWPPSVDLEGFQYERLGAMRRRSTEKWIDWLERDHTFSTQPYVQLASVMLTAGHRGTAEDIQFAERNRERREAWHRGDWFQWGWLMTLFVVVGYGIGLYTFLALGPVIILTLLGAMVAFCSPEAQRHSIVWSLGASLHRLLPVAELNKEFNDFFDDPKNLTRCQAVFFAVLAILGWVLGFFLIAAIGGLLPKG